MGIVELEAVDRSAVGQRGIRRADLLAPRKQRGRTAAAEADRDVGGDLAPGLRRAEKPAADRIEQARLQMSDDFGRHGGKRELRRPLSQARRDGDRSPVSRPSRHGLFQQGERIERALVDSDAEPRTARRRHVTVLHDEIGFGTNGSGPMTPRPKMNSPAGMTCSAGRLA